MSNETPKPNTIENQDTPTIAERMERTLFGRAPYKPATPTPSIHPLYDAFDAAVKQATKGKGERHGGEASPFFDQPWYSTAKQTGVGGLVFQMMKKAGEAVGKPDQEAFERELLGAMVYAGMAYLYVRKHGFKAKD